MQKFTVIEWQKKHRLFSMSRRKQLRPFKVLDEEGDKIESTNHRFIKQFELVTNGQKDKVQQPYFGNFIYWITLAIHISIHS